MADTSLPSLADIEDARLRIRGIALRTPLVRLNVDAPVEIHLKLENLQPIGAFKIRGAANALARLPAHARAKGLLTASAGNMAQGAFPRERPLVPGGHPFLADEVWKDAVRPHFSGHLVVGRDLMGRGSNIG